MFHEFSGDATFIKHSHSKRCIATRAIIFSFLLLRVTRIPPFKITGWSTLVFLVFSRRQCMRIVCSSSATWWAHGTQHFVALARWGKWKKWCMYFRERKKKKNSPRPFLFLLARWNGIESISNRNREWTAKLRKNYRERINASIVAFLDGKSNFKGNFVYSNYRILII